MVFLPPQFYLICDRTRLSSGGEDANSSFNAMLNFYDIAFGIRRGFVAAGTWTWLIGTGS
ncbi:hypothetical protein RHECNPAF_890093 [Rhizobium etli CNPAF512]|nr:hypothetical protein RHECNPAF_890093 [Rhizobium etli CNPAF512]